MPVRTDGALLGVMGFASLRDRDFSTQQDLLEHLAAITAQAMKKTQDLDSLQAKNQALTGQLADCASKLASRHNELEQLNRLFAQREFRINSLKVQIKALEGSQ